MPLEEQQNIVQTRQDVERHPQSKKDNQEKIKSAQYSVNTALLSFLPGMGS
jgi:hypothetical protein